MFFLLFSLFFLTKNLNIPDIIAIFDTSNNNQNRNAMKITGKIVNGRPVVETIEDDSFSWFFPEGFLAERDERNAITSETLIEPTDEQKAQWLWEIEQLPVHPSNRRK